MERILKYMQAQGGYARMKQLKASGAQTRDVRRLCREGELLRVKPGLYRLSKIPPQEHSALVEICLAMPKAVICLASALAFHELTTFVPPRVTFAIPISDKPIGLPSLPNEHFFFSRRVYGAGIEHVHTRSGTFRVYSLEKTLCDVFRFRMKIGEDLALEALKEYLGRRNRNLQKLMTFAELCRVKGILAPYVRALLA